MLTADAPAGDYSVRELTPEKQSYPALASELKELSKELRPELTLEKQPNFLSMCRQWGEILAESHARADNKYNKVSIAYSFEDEAFKITSGKQQEFCQLAYHVTRDYANQVEIDYKEFKQWWAHSNIRGIKATP